MYLKEITRDVLNLPSIKAGERGGGGRGERGRGGGGGGGENPQRGRERDDGKGEGYGGGGVGEGDIIYFPLQIEQQITTVFTPLPALRPQEPLTITQSFRGGKGKGVGREGGRGEGGKGERE